MVTIHEKEIQDAAMAKLAKVHGHRTDSVQVPGLYAVADARPETSEEREERKGRHGSIVRDRGSYWTVALHMGDRAMSTSYYMGSAHREPPKADDVLLSLCMDAQSYDGARNFEDWAGEYGMDTDSRKAEHMYHHVAEQAKALRHLLGKDYEAVVARGAREWEADT